MVGLLKLNGTAGYPIGWKLLDLEGAEEEAPPIHTHPAMPMIDVESVRQLHRHELRDKQCSSVLVKHINAPIHLVWSLVRRFDEPQKYKPFVSRCRCIVRGRGGGDDNDNDNDNLEIGSVREVNVQSGLPATTSTELLEQLDDKQHILGIRILGGDHRLNNYTSIVTVHPTYSHSLDLDGTSTVVESFAVDVPEGNTEDETCYFVEAVIQCNLNSLAHISERLARQQPLLSQQSKSQIN